MYEAIIHYMYVHINYVIALKSIPTGTNVDDRLESDSEQTNTTDFDEDEENFRIILRDDS